MGPSGWLAGGPVGFLKLDTYCQMQVPLSKMIVYITTMCYPGRRLVRRRDGRLMVSPLGRGRGVGRIRTPGLIRDYLVGQGPFAEDPPEELAQRRAEGAYVAQIHQRVKQYIRDLSKELHYKYQWPRRHSFNARINDLLLLGLLVKTGEAAPEKVEPQERGAGQLGSAGGFSLKLWVRMAPGADTRPEWADLIGYIDKHYAEKALAEGRPPPNIRPQRRALAIAVQQVAQVGPAVLRPSRRRAQVSETAPV